VPPPRITVILDRLGGLLNHAQQRDEDEVGGQVEDHVAKHHEIGQVHSGGPVVSDVQETGLDVLPERIRRVNVEVEHAVLLLALLERQQAVERRGEARDNTQRSADGARNEEGVLGETPLQRVEHGGQEPEVVRGGDALHGGRGGPDKVAGDADGELLEPRRDPAEDVNVPAELVDGDEGARETGEKRDVEEHTNGGEEHRDVAGPELLIEHVRVGADPAGEKQEEVVAEDEPTHARVVVVDMGRVRAQGGIGINPSHELQGEERDGCGCDDRGLDRESSVTQ